MLLFGLKRKKELPGKKGTGAARLVPDRNGRILGPGIDPDWPQLYWRDEEVILVALCYLRPEDYISGVYYQRMLCMTMGWLGGIGLFMMGSSANTPVLYGVGIAVIVLGYILRGKALESGFREKLRWRKGVTTKIFLGPERIRFENACENYPVERGRAALTTDIEPHERAEMEIDKIRSDRNIRDIKWASWRKAVWGQSFAVNINYGSHIVKVAEIHDRVMARRLAAGINAAENILIEDLAKWQKKAGPWERRRR